MIFMKKFVPSFMSNYVQNLLTRIRSLELAVEVLIESPQYNEQSPEAFNEQQLRIAIFKEITALFKPEHIIETGSFTGNTTGYMASLAKVPVDSCEAIPYIAALARKRLRAVPNAHIVTADSRSFLLTQAKSALSNRRTFFYLDAHWYSDLPLTKEIDIIATHWESFVIMIDDFRVPHDPGYLFDKDARGRSLDYPLVASQIKKHALDCYYPGVSSEQESGSKKGCIIVAPKSISLQSIKQLMHREKH